MNDLGEIVVRRRLPAPIADVFRWWTEAERLREWMSPIGTVEADVDLRVGGAFRIVMHGAGQSIEHVGEYLEIDPPRRLVFTWRSQFTGPEASQVLVELEPDGQKGTYLRLVHSRLPETAQTSHGAGWGAMLQRLEGCMRAQVHGG